jgi:hypothetical protein
MKSPGETLFNVEFNEVSPGLLTFRTAPWPQPLAWSVKIPKVRTP